MADDVNGIASDTLSFLRAYISYIDDVDDNGNDLRSVNEIADYLWPRIHNGDFSKLIGLNIDEIKKQARLILLLSKHFQQEMIIETVRKLIYLFLPYEPPPPPPIEYQHYENFSQASEAARSLAERYNDDIFIRRSLNGWAIFATPQVISDINEEYLEISHNDFMYEDDSSDDNWDRKIDYDVDFGYLDDEDYY